MQNNTKTVLRKIPGGKLLRIEYKIDKQKSIKDQQQQKITYLKITGDFFIHPEEKIEEIEQLIITTDQIHLEETLNNFITKENITIIGFSIKDLIELLNENNNPC